VPAQDLHADLVLLDEIGARRLARRQALAVLGCVGVPEEAFGRRSPLPPPDSRDPCR
jgi:predicted nucleic acid-binding protein